MSTLSLPVLILLVSCTTVMSHTIQTYPSSIIRHHDHGGSNGGMVNDVSSPRVMGHEPRSPQAGFRQGMKLDHHVNDEANNVHSLEDSVEMPNVVKSRPRRWLECELFGLCQNKWHKSSSWGYPVQQRSHNNYANFNPWNRRWVASNSNPWHFHKNSHVFSTPRRTVNFHDGSHCGFNDGHKYGCY